MPTLQYLRILEQNHAKIEEEHRRRVVRVLLREKVGQCEAHRRREHRHERERAHLWYRNVIICQHPEWDSSGVSMEFRTKRVDIRIFAC